MKYIYQAKKGPQDSVEGAIEAPNQDTAIANLVKQGLVPVFIQEEGEQLAAQSSKSKKRGPGRTSFRKRVSGKDIYLFAKQMRVLLKSHVPILNSLYILEGQATSIPFKEVIESIINAVREGANFSESLEKFPQHFSLLFISIIKAGEAGGNLDLSFDQIAKYLEREMQLSQCVKSSLAYPVVMVTVGIATVVFLMTFVVPKLTVLFEDMTDKLPFITKVLLDTSQFFSRFWVLLVVATVALVVFLYQTREALWQKKAVYIIKKKLPVVNSIIYNQSLCRLARGLSMLLTSGVSAAESIRIATPLVNDEVAQAGLENAHRRILSGGGLAESLKEECLFLPDIFIKMIAVGESSGRLDEILGELADDYASNVDTETKVMTSLIEPIAILVIGAILGLIVIAVLLPIFDMSFIM